MKEVSRMKIILSAAHSCGCEWIVQRLKAKEELGKGYIQKRGWYWFGPFLDQDTSNKRNKKNRDYRPSLLILYYTWLNKLTLKWVMLQRCNEADWH